MVYRNKNERRGFRTTTIQDILKEERFKYYPIKGLINKYLVIEGVKIQQGDEDSFCETRNLNLKMVKRLDEFYYLGYLYEIKNGNVTPFDKIGEVRIYLSQIYFENYNYYCDADICIYYNDEDSEEPWVDPLQYDEDKKTIVNAAGKIAPEIKKHKINLTLGEKQHAEFKSNRKGKVYRR